jgi:hypothetical protein
MVTSLVYTEKFTTDEMRQQSEVIAKQQEVIKYEG